jgi:thiol-disulfide isomerase/thioredoxin
MPEEQKANTNQPAEVDSNSKALQVNISGQLQTLTDEEKALFQMYSSEGQGVKMNIPEIRVNYDEDNGIRGGFILLTSEPDATGKMQKIKTFLDTKIAVTILRTRFKFGYFDADEGPKGMEILGTPELDDYNGEVDLWDNKAKKVIFTGAYKEFKKYIVANYPDVELQDKYPNSSMIKHTEILYVELDGMVCRMYLAKSSRDLYWEYKEEIKGVPTFAYKTELTTTKEKKGATTYFPIHFKQVSENDIKKYLGLRKQLDADLKLFDEARANLKPSDSDTVKGGNPEDEIKRKWNINFPEGYVYPNCPKCGEKMVLKDSFKGAFFGCSKFPDCDGIMELTGALKGEVQDGVPVINLDEQGDVKEATAPSPEEVDGGKKEGEEEVKVDNIPF